MLYDDIIVICYYIVNKKNIIGLINIIIKCQKEDQGDRRKT